MTTTTRGINTSYETEQFFGMMEIQFGRDFKRALNFVFIKLSENTDEAVVVNRLVLLVNQGKTQAIVNKAYDLGWNG